MWRDRIATNGCFIRTKNTGFLETDFFSCITQIIDVIDIYAGDYGHIRIKNIDRIKATTKTYFQNNHIKFGFCQQLATTY